MTHYLPRYHLGAIACTLAIPAALFASGCEPTETIVVRTTADGGGGSLRDAIRRANAGKSPTVIEVPAGEYRLTTCGADDDNRRGDLDIISENAVTISGAGSGAVIVQTCAGERVVDAHGAGLLTLQNVTIRGGSVKSVDPTLPASGGGVRAQADVVLHSATITGNSATGAQGLGIASDGTGIEGGTALGGGLYVGGSLTAIDSTLSANVATAGNGGVSEQGASSGGNAEGGGAYVLNAIALQRGTISANLALGGAGVSGSFPSAGGAARGGGLAQGYGTGNVDVIGTTFTDNAARSGIAGEGGALLHQAPAHYQGAATGGALAAARVLTASQITATGNKAVPGASAGCPACSPSVGRGGAVASAGETTITDSEFLNNAVPQSPAIACASSYPPVEYDPECPYLITPFASRTLCFPPQTPDLEYICSHNCIYKLVDPVYTCGPSPTPSTGAAISVENYATVNRSLFRNNAAADSSLDILANLTISESELLNNSSGIHAAAMSARALTLAAADGAPAIGPALSLSIWSTDVSRLVNTTIAGPVGPIMAAQLELEHATITTSGSAAAPLLQVKSLTARRSVVVHTGAPICAPDVTVASSAYNWFGDASCNLAGPSDQQSSADFRLAPLADNGGSVQTRLPGAGSVLLNRIAASECPTLTDARGVTRPQASACDIGAVEAVN